MSQAFSLQIKFGAMNPGRCPGVALGWYE